VCSFFGLIIISPILCVFILLIWLQDLHSPFYIAPRVGLNGVLFRMVKLRSMVFGANKSKVDSTTTNDKRIIRIGLIIRRYKLDEFLQLWNVLKGDMSLVGPRPQVQRRLIFIPKKRGICLMCVPASLTFLRSYSLTKETYLKAVKTLILDITK